jgi:CheY-like chemotaxis protein
MARILVIEDETHIRDNLLRFVRLEGHAALQADAALQHVPLVFLSASAESERLEEALRLGASGYVTKPFNFAQLQAVLKQHLPR